LLNKELVSREKYPKHSSKTFYKTIVNVCILVQHDSSEIVLPNRDEKSFMVFFIILV